ncbi:MAG: hypothetical protein PHP62_05350 [Candidatus Moranbacteria bacterium]|nr:hypothetical protein [Candidatus Moranbacteria bacterium]
MKLEKNQKYFQVMKQKAFTGTLVLKRTVLYGIFVLFAASLFAGDKQNYKLANGTVEFDWRECDAELSYHINGKIVKTAQLQLVDATVRNIVKKDPEGTLNVEFNNGVSLTVSAYGKNPYFKLSFDSPPEKKNILLLKNFRSEVMVIPDTLSDNYIFFSDDNDATNESGRIFPGFHTVAYLLDEGQAMLICSWLNALQVFSGSENGKNGKLYDYCKIEFIGKNSFQIGVPAADGIWREIKKRPQSGLEFKEIDWHPPFRAKWRINYRLMNHLPCGSVFIDESLPIISKNRKCGALVPGFSLFKSDIWQGYDQVNGACIYPVYLKDNKLFIRELRFLKEWPQIDTAHRQVIYAVDAIKSQQDGVSVMPMPILKTLLPRDINNAMKHHKIWKGTGICSTTGKIGKIFEKNQQKKQIQEIEKYLKGMNEFIVHINGRCKDYRTWQIAVMTWMREESARNPKLKPLGKELENTIINIQNFWEENLPIIKTPEHFSGITRQISNLADSGLDEEKQEEKCKKFCRQLRIAGGRLHHTIGKFRQTVRAARYVAVHKLWNTNSQDEADFLNEFIEKSSIIIYPHHCEEGK